MHSNQDKAEAPCRHMERMLQEAASNRSRGLVRWYTLAHAARCGRCGRFLASLRAMIAGLRSERATQTDEAAIERLAVRLK
ncbi:MAG TPA: hypothetical protein VKT78_05395 [Fimbriimonadaceae bacterium]|nr:hypothetical protein [Fimbriimonadaceae bacterium]